MINKDHLEKLLCNVRDMCSKFTDCEYCPLLYSCEDEDPIHMPKKWTNKEIEEVLSYEPERSQIYGNGQG